MTPQPQRRDWLCLIGRSLPIVLLAGVAGAATLTVDDDQPADFASIQSAINAAADNDEIVVKPGRYRETLSFLGKSITVRSEAGPLRTVIFLEGETRIVNLDGNSTLQGFTITGGRQRVGGGILVSGNVQPLITENIIANNTAEWNDVTGFPGLGGGIAVEAPAEPVISRNVIRDNLATGDLTGLYGFGGGVEVGDYASAVIRNNVLLRNRATDTGGGIYLGFQAGTTSPVVITNNTIVGNEAGDGSGPNTFSFGGGLSLYDGTLATIQNNVFSQNLAAYQGGGIYFYPNNDAGFDYDANDFDGNQPDDCAGLPASKCDGGQFFLAPLFQDAAADNYRLRSDSELLDLGVAGFEGTLDIEDRTRNRDSDLDGISAPDIGAYENQGEITRVVFSAANTLSWDSSSNTAITFDLYQDTLDNLGPGSAGVCWQTGISNTSTGAGGDPLSGQTYFYLVTGRDQIAGSLGFDSLGGERVPAFACP